MLRDRQPSTNPDVQPARVRPHHHPAADLAQIVVDTVTGGHVGGKLGDGVVQHFEVVGGVVGCRVAWP